eukprot:TRINITY_DN70953_c0_g1_i1.p1 TRINITY_DN70953_c0_g1~~TRINITY_DN70953_c0_g1_i1.p1  ORF type:complete len:422 (+),score=62.60 TRINITY_DN70953_c0_g1_i1:75-1268(+)
MQGGVVIPYLTLPEPYQLHTTPDNARESLPAAERQGSRRAAQSQGLAHVPGVALLRLASAEPGALRNGSASSSGGHRADGVALLRLAALIPDGAAPASQQTPVLDPQSALALSISLAQTEDSVTLAQPVSTVGLRSASSSGICTHHGTDSASASGSGAPKRYAVGEVVVERPAVVRPSTARRTLSGAASCARRAVTPAPPSRQEGPASPACPTAPPSSAPVSRQQPALSPPAHQQGAAARLSSSLPTRAGRPQRAPSSRAVPVTAYVSPATGRGVRVRSNPNGSVQVLRSFSPREDRPYLRRSGGGGRSGFALPAGGVGAPARRSSGTASPSVPLRQPPSLASGHSAAKQGPAPGTYARVLAPRRAPAAGGPGGGGRPPEAPGAAGRLRRSSPAAGK